MKEASLSPRAGKQLFVQPNKENNSDKHIKILMQYIKLHTMFVKCNYERLEHITFMQLTLY